MNGSIYAQGTSVSVDRSKAELSGLLARHKADAVLMGHDNAQGLAYIAFRLLGRNVKLNMPLPKLEDFRHRQVRRHRQRMDDATTLKYWEQACRERWRAVVLLTKAKLEAIQIGFSSVEREFMHDLLTPNGETLGELFKSGMLERVLGPTNVPLLMGPRPAAPVPAPVGHPRERQDQPIDGEFIDG